MFYVHTKPDHYGFVFEEKTHARKPHDYRGLIIIEKLRRSFQNVCWAGETKTARKDNVLKFLRFEERLICGKRIREDDKLNRTTKAAFPTGISTAHSELID